MTQERAKRKLSAVLSADVKGYSRLMGQDEAGTVRRIKEYRKLITDLVHQYRGRVVDSPGDNILAEFVSAVDAAECAIRIQRALKERNREIPDERKMAFRIGINLGDVIDDGERIYGDGINIAARMESLAQGGGICISGTLYDQIKNKLGAEFENLGRQRVKNIADPVRVYRVITDTETAKSPALLLGKWRKRIGGIALLVLIAAIGGFLSWHYYLQPSKHQASETASPDRMSFPLPEKPSIAVLPFDNLSEEPNQEYIADGLTENITAALSKLSEIFVISRNSTSVYKNKPVTVQQVSEELGVRNVLGGSIQKSGDDLRITAQLMDATTGYQVWAEHYDRKLKDLFDLQDEITLKIISALEVKLTDGDRAEIGSPTENLAAWSYGVRGADLFEQFTWQDNQRARKYLEKAVEIDPEYAFAWIMLAWTHVIDAWFGYSKSPPLSIQTAEALAEKAARLGGDHPGLYSLWSTIHLNRKEYDEAVKNGLKAVSIGPNNALSHVLLAYVMLFAGNFNGAVNYAERAIRLTPYCPDWYLFVLGQSYRQAGRLKEALSAYKKALDRSKQNKTNHVASLLGLIDVCMALGREAEARKYAAEVMRITSDFSFKYFHQVYPYKDPAHLQRIISNLRKAGLK